MSRYLLVCYVFVNMLLREHACLRAETKLRVSSLQTPSALKRGRIVNVHF